MSLFQCSKCGCCENTALSNGSRSHFNNLYWPNQYREALGLAEGEQFGDYCSECSPAWFDNGYYGVGPNPDPRPGVGQWHGKFPRNFYPMNSMRTNHEGNLVPKSESR